MNAIKRCSLFVSIYRCDVMMMEASMAGENVSIHNSMVVKNHWAWALLVLVLRLFEFARVFHLKQKVNWTIHDISASTLMASNDCLCVLIRFTSFTQNAAVLPRKQVSFSQAAILLMKNSLLLPSYSSSSAFHISFALYDHSEHHSAVFFFAPVKHVEMDFWFMSESPPFINYSLLSFRNCSYLKWKLWGKFFEYFMSRAMWFGYDGVWREVNEFWRAKGNFQFNKSLLLLMSIHLRQGSHHTARLPLQLPRIRRKSSRRVASLQSHHVRNEFSSRIFM